MQFPLGWRVINLETRAPPPGYLEHYADRIEGCALVLLEQVDPTKWAITPVMPDAPKETT